MKKMFAVLAAAVMLVGSECAVPESERMITANAADNAVVWKIGTVEAKPGDTVTVNIYADENTAVAVAGAQYTINNTEGWTPDSVSAVSEAYKANITANLSSSEYAFADASGAGNVCKNGDIVMSITYSIPADCKEGTYPITWGDGSFMFVSSGDGEDITNQIITIDGAVNVIGAVEPGFLLGDVDGDGVITAMDASAVLTYYVTQPADDEIDYVFNKEVADYDGNGVINAMDASAILTYYVSQS